MTLIAGKTRMDFWTIFFAVFAGVLAANAASALYTAAVEEFFRN